MIPLFNEWLNEAINFKQTLDVLIKNDPNNFEVYDYIQKYFETKTNKIYWFTDKDKKSDKVKKLNYPKELTKKINNFTLDFNGRLGIAKMADASGNNTYFYDNNNELGF